MKLCVFHQCTARATRGEYCARHSPGLLTFLEPVDYVAEQESLNVDKPIDYYSPERAPATVERMLGRYSTPRAAADMAWGHACDWPEDSRERAYWKLVVALIRLRMV